MMQAGKITGKPVKRRMGIQQALEWAFGREKACLDLGVLDPENNRGAAIGNEWIIWQRFMLGATVDGGGGSWGGSMPHSDAEVIAAFVANLDVARGGRAMAVQIADLASAGITPDWMPGATVRCIPRDWKDSRYGRFARTEVCRTVETVHRGRRTKRTDLWCPVTYTPTQQQIAAARRNYLDWWGALLYLAADLRNCDMLGMVEVTSAMPKMTPWRRDVADA